MTANTLPTRSYVLDDVIACLRSLAVGRIAPSSRTYDEKRSPGLPNARLLWLHGTMPRAGPRRCSCNRYSMRCGN